MIGENITQNITFIDGIKAPGQTKEVLNQLLLEIFQMSNEEREELLHLWKSLYLREAVH